MPSTDEPLTDDEPGEEPDKEPDEEPAAEQDPDPAVPAGSRRKVVLISAAAVVVLAVAGLAVYLVTRDDSAGTADGGPGVPTIEGSAPAERSEAPPANSTPPSMSRSSVPSAPAGGQEAGEAQSVAEQAATAISNADADALVQLSCDPDSVGADDTLPENAKVEVVGEPEISGDTATVDVRVTVPGAEPAEVPMPLIKQDGRWCIPS